MVNPNINVVEKKVLAAVKIKAEIKVIEDALNSGY
jgi:hypothetical protein